MASGALVASILLTIVLGSPSPPSALSTVRLGVVALVAVASRAVFFPGVHRRLLGPYAAPLELTLELALALFALSLTGGVRSDLYPLLLLGAVLAYRLEGREAGRFLTIETVLGLAYLVSLSPPAASALGESLAPLVLRGLWPMAILLAFEVRAGRAEARAAAPSIASDGLLHDLKSPLSVIRAYTDLIAEGGARGEPPSAEHLANLGREVDLMESIVGAGRRKSAAGTARTASAVNTVNTVSDVRTAGPRPRPSRVDLVPILSSLAEAYRAAHGNRHRIEFMADDAEIQVLADPVALQRSFRNVLDNSVKYSPDGGAVRIRAGARSDRAYVVFADSGPGMTPEEEARAFQFSYRGPGAVASGIEGKGLGLGVSRELLEANGGRISLRSEPGQGLEVTVDLPAFRERRVRERRA